MSIGANIKRLREERKLTQEQVAEALGITFQAVSSWERDEYKPDTEKLIKLAELFDVSVSAIAEERHKAFKTKETIYNWEHMKTYYPKLLDAIKATPEYNSAAWLLKYQIESMLDIYKRLM